MGSLRKVLRPLALASGTTVGKTANKNDILAFLRGCHPFESGHNLIRLGGEGDGGYLIPDDLGDIAACFSPGVSFTASFEAALMERGIPCFLADASVDAPPEHHKLIHFTKKHLATINSDQTMRLSDWVRANAPVDGDLILQMDIEGAEYPVLLDTEPETLDRFRIVVVEFHDLDRVFDRFDINLFDSLFKKLLTNFTIVHIHPNNCTAPTRFSGIEIPPLIEFTFLRNDRLTDKKKRSNFPHPLDQDNAPGRPTVVIGQHFFD